MGCCNFMRDSSEKTLNIKKLLIIIVVFSLAIWFYIYSSEFYVIVRFNELGALTKNMSAYYNGFRIGKIVKIEPDDDFKHTLVKVKLVYNNLNLPQNTTVKVENFADGTLYLEFVYPSSPSFSLMKKNDMLEGTAPYSLEQFMLGQNISGVSDVVSLHVIQALNATTIANQEMTTFFQNTSKIITENSKAIKASVNNTAAMTKSLARMAGNLNQSSQNLNQLSTKINRAFDENTLNEYASNIKSTTSNLKDTTDNISRATKDIDKTMKKIDDTISEANSTAKNLNTMTGGLNETFTQRFGGMRVLFGTPIKPKN